MLLLEGKALGCSDKLVNGHCIYCFSSCIHRIEYTRSWVLKVTPCHLRLLPPTSTSTASGATTWTPCWRPSPSSNARMSRRSAHTARGACHASSQVGL